MNPPSCQPISGEIYIRIKTTVEFHEVNGYFHSEFHSSLQYWNTFIIDNFFYKPYNLKGCQSIPEWKLKEK